MRPPSSPTRTNSVARPSIRTSCWGNQALKPNALPVRCLQAMQWQTDRRTGSPEHVADSCPHEHCARRVVRMLEVYHLGRARVRLTSSLDGGRSASMCRAGRGPSTEVAREFAGDSIDERDSRKAAMFGDRDDRTLGLRADSRECLARLRGAAQLRLCQLGQMFEVLLAQIRAPAIGHCGYIPGVELTRRHPIEKHCSRREMDTAQLRVRLYRFGNRETVGSRDLYDCAIAPIAHHARDVARLLANDAVAEGRERGRRHLEQAHRLAAGGGVDDDDISSGRLGAVEPGFVVNLAEHHQLTQPRRCLDKKLIEAAGED